MTGLDYPRRPTVAAESARVVDRGHLLDNDLLPWSHFVTGGNRPDHTLGTVGGSRAAAATWWFGALWWTTTVSAEIGWDFYLAAGTWRAEWFCDKRADYPVVRLLVDGVSKGDADHYAATRVRFVRRVDGLVLAQGWHRFLMRAMPKVAASTGHTMTFSGLALTRTA